MPYNQITLRVNAQTREAAIEGRDFLVYGDKVIILLTDAPGAKIASLTADIWTKTASPVWVAGGPTFTAVTKSPGCFTSSAIELQETNLADALAATPPGSHVTFRLFVNDADFTFVDMDIDIRPNPTTLSTPVSSLGNPYVTRAELAGVIAGVTPPAGIALRSEFVAFATVLQALPSDNMEEINAKLDRLIAMFAAMVP